MLSDDHAADSLVAAEAALFGGSANSSPSRSFEITHAYQGQEAYELLTRESQQGRPFALAFVDMRMPPGWDGLETIKRLWHVEPQLQVVLCTAYSDYSWFEICEALSPGDRLLILKKPFDAVEVRQLAATLVTKWNLGRAAERSQRDLERQVLQRTHELQEAKEAADRASQSKSDFLANISHEIRTPLTAILGFTRLLMDGVDDAVQRGEYLQIIRASAEHQLTLINDLLDVSRIEAGKLEIHRVACSVPDIVDEVLQTLRFRAEEKGLTLASECRSPLDEPVYTDPSRLRQLLLNLVNNALKFTASGSVRVVMNRTIADGRDKLRIDVIDTGIGIPEDKQGIIFDPFVQADASIAPRFGGTGLGLTISRSIAGLLGGSLTVTSREGEGSTFTLLVDTERPTTTDVCTQRTITHVDGVAQAALDGRRILLVEDHPFNRKLIALTLSRAGANVDTAENGQVGLEKASSAAYDLVLMDIQMPVMNGYTATKRLREAGYRGPIIALTAHALPAERERCLLAGCDAFVGKPIDLDHLKAVVRQFLSAGRLARDPGSDRQLESAEDASPEYRQLVGAFLGSLTEAHTEREAVAETNYEALATIAHTLKGSGGTFGFPELTAAAEQLELAVIARTHDRIREKLDRLGALVAQLQDRHGDCCLPAR